MNPNANNQRGGRGGRFTREPKEFAEKLVEVSRVTRVVKGGKRLRFRALVIIGDGKGRVAYGVAKASEVPAAISKAVADAKKRLITVNFSKGTLPYKISHLRKGTTIMLKPAGAGVGIIAGGAVRLMLEAAGFKNALGKIIGSTNKINNTITTYEALQLLEKPESMMIRRDKKIASREGSEEKATVKEAPKKKVAKKAVNPKGAPSGEK